MQLDWSSVAAEEVENWQRKARSRLCRLLALPDAIAPPEVAVSEDSSIANGYRRQRLYVRFGTAGDAPVDIVTRKDPAPSPGAPVVVCMQGSNSGAHLNLGEVRMPADVYKIAAGSALALQAADRGFIAISFERACYGERRERNSVRSTADAAIDASLHALSLGETLLGQTVAELEALRQWVDAEIAPGSPVYLAGYSAAGTAAIATAAAIPAFAGVAVGGCVGMMRDTILRRRASGYNDIPGILDWFEFDALLALIAPRPCLVIAGVKDHIWPYSAAEKVIASARRAWEGLDAGGVLILEEGSQGHTYYPDLMWPAVEQLISAK